MLSSWIPRLRHIILGSGPGAIAIPQLTLLGKPIYLEITIVVLKKAIRRPRYSAEDQPGFCYSEEKWHAEDDLQKWQMWNDQQAEIGIA